MRRFSLAIIFYCFAPISIAAPACSNALPADICEMERDLYTRTDFQQTEDVRRAMVLLKNLLVVHDGDPAIVRDHILGLVDQVVSQAQRVRAPRGLYLEAAGHSGLFSIDRQLRAYERRNGPVVPLDWDLPEGVRLLTFVVEKYYEPSRDHTEYRFGLFGGLEQKGIVDSLQIWRYPNELIADKQDSGAWHEATIDHTKTPIFSLGGSTGSNPLAEGLYLIDIKVRGQPPVKGWFILSHATPTAIPVVQVPTLNETFSTHTPSFRWLDFQSPLFRPFEHRKRRLGIRSVDNGHRVDWSWSAINPEPLTTLTVGPQTGELKSLKAGSYEFHASFEERWLAGSGFFLGRASTTVIPFRIGGKAPSPQAVSWPTSR